jgi:hypothetical protein
MTMKRTKQDQAAEAIKRLSRLLPFMWEFTEGAISEATAKMEGKPFDVYLFSHIVRYEICRGLDSLPKDFNLQRSQHPLSGIEFLYEGFVIKVWKADGGEMPIAGASSNRQDFLSQT